MIEALVRNTIFLSYLDPIFDPILISLTLTIDNKIRNITEIWIKLAIQLDLKICKSRITNFKYLLQTHKKII